MEPFFDRLGRVKNWVDTDRGWILDLHGHHVAFIRGSSIYNWQGQHVGWWHDDHARSHYGQVLGFMRKAGGMGVARPALAAVPARPAIAAVPARPAIAAVPAMAARSSSWSDESPF
ncbi:4-fold beta flower protein [Devosia submarina]|uniref:4-fold beta flower protein n=1 Tax=Devosia submarina TaxID=1173082 RepID=UPI000D356FE0|nr:hypothetical protein [Devosia submarina]